MSVRKLAPKRIQPALREIYVACGAATAPLRMTPEFMIIGGHRCGTTSLFKALAEHPQIMRPPVNKGTDYYTLYSSRSESWYRGHFPLASTASVRARRVGRAVAFEACTYYMFHPLAPERIAQDFPQMKFIAMLRDPVERAFSAYKHEHARGFEWEPDFERALDLEPDRLVGEIERMSADPTYESFAHRHHAYVSRGQYAEQIARLSRWFPAESLHVVESDAFFAAPEKVYDDILGFLDVAPFQPGAFDRHNARPSKQMPPQIASRLTTHFKPHDERLADLLGRRLSWMS